MNLLWVFYFKECYEIAWLIGQILTDPLLTPSMVWDGPGGVITYAWMVDYVKGKANIIDKFIV